MPSAVTCTKCHASLREATPTEPSPAQLYIAFVDPELTREQIARMKPDRVKQMVAYRRKKKVTPKMKELPMSDERIASVLQAYARGELRRDIESLTERDLLADILDAQQQILQANERQTRYLESIRTATQLWLVLTILGLIAGCFLILLGGAGL